MSARGQRAQRRADERRRNRSLRAAVSPDIAHPSCLVPGCAEPAPSVRIGPVVIALCAAHKRSFDDRYASRAGRRLSAARV